MLTHNLSQRLQLRFDRNDGITQSFNGSFSMKKNLNNVIKKQKGRHETAVEIERKRDYNNISYNIKYLPTLTESLHSSPECDGLGHIGCSANSCTKSLLRMANKYPEKKEEIITGIKKVRDQAKEQYNEEFKYINKWKWALGLLNPRIYDYKAKSGLNKNLVQLYSSAINKLEQ